MKQGLHAFVLYRKIAGVHVINNFPEITDCTHTLPVICTGIPPPFISTSETKSGKPSETALLDLPQV